MNLTIRGWDVVSPCGVGKQAFLQALATPPTALRELTVPGFDVRALLGRKGTSFLDRRSALAMVACDLARADAELTINDSNRDRIGSVLGTTWGSLGAMMDYSRDTLSSPKPYQVDPLLFPNTVINCAGGQVAIRLAARGVSLTVAGGHLSLFQVLHAARQLIHAGRATTLFAGVVDELTPHTEAALRLGATRSAAAEGAAVFVVEGNGAKAGSEILATSSAYAPGGDPSRVIAALARMIHSVCERAQIDPAAIDCVAPISTRGTEIDDAALQVALGGSNPRRAPKLAWLGDALAASAGFTLAAILGGRGSERCTTLMTGWTSNGAVGAALVRA